MRAKPINAMARLWSPRTTGLITLPVWFLLLQICTTANEHHFRGRTLLLTSLGGVVFCVLLVNILAVIKAVRLVLAGATSNIVGIVLNGIQVLAIAGLIVFGLFLSS